MMKRLSIRIAFIFPAIFALHQGLNALDAKESSYFQSLSLCQMGCRCPINEHSSGFLDCTQRGLATLPSQLSLESPLTSVSFQNNRLKFLNMTTFNKADNIHLLDLSNNMLEKIDNLTFAPFRHLEKLKLSHNRLPDISQGLLGGLGNLRVLEMNHNGVMRLDPEVFLDTPKLQELRLQSNPLFELPDKSFWYLTNLEKLDLEDTGLVSLSDQLFLPTPGLQWLSLSDNAFEIVPRAALVEAQLLQSLDLSGNDFTTFVDGDFEGLSGIKTLYLNKLTLLLRVESGGFAGLTGLDTLSLSYNPHLHFMDENAFGPANATVLPRRQLYLRQNALKSLSTPPQLESWRSLSFVDLADNPWSCDCSIGWLRHLPLETQMNLACDAPSNLHGRPFGTLHPSEIKCADNWTMAVNIAMVGFAVGLGVLVLAAAAVVCSRTPGGLYVRAKKQFSYSKVQRPPKQECVDLEWDPSADI